MRNLMGRLNTRSDEELQRISVAWMAPGSARDRAGLIAQLMRAMTDLRAVRDFWTRRSASEQEMIAYFVANGPEDGATIADLAVELGHDEAEVRATATRLYRPEHWQPPPANSPGRSGSCHGSSAPELGQLFARMQDELEAGDISRASPAALLESWTMRTSSEPPSIGGWNRCRPPYPARG